MPTAPLIAYSHVAKTFDGGRVNAVDDVSLEVAEGEFLAIVGGSGSGKTTLLRLANRLIEADGGSITVEGEDVRSADPIGLRRRIGYVFQSGALFPHMSVAGNIGVTPKTAGLAGGGDFRARRRTARSRPARPRTNIATACRMNCQADSASASAWRGRLPQSRASC